MFKNEFADSGKASLLPYRGHFVVLDIQEVSIKGTRIIPVDDAVVYFDSTEIRILKGTDLNEVIKIAGIYFNDKVKKPFYTVTSNRYSQVIIIPGEVPELQMPVMILTEDKMFPKSRIIGLHKSLIFGEIMKGKTDEIIQEAQLTPKEIVANIKKGIKQIIGHSLSYLIDDQTMYKEANEILLKAESNGLELSKQLLDLVFKPLQELKERPGVENSQYEIISMEVVFNILFLIQNQINVAYYKSCGNNLEYKTKVDILSAISLYQQNISPKLKELFIISTDQAIRFDIERKIYLMQTNLFR